MKEEMLQMVVKLRKFVNIAEEHGVPNLEVNNIRDEIVDLESYILMIEG